MEGELIKLMLIYGGMSLLFCCTVYACAYVVALILQLLVGGFLSYIDRRRGNSFGSAPEQTKDGVNDNVSPACLADAMSGRQSSEYAAASSSVDQSKAVERACTQDEYADDGDYCSTDCREGKAEEGDCRSAYGREGEADNGGYGSADSGEGEADVDVDNVYEDNTVELCPQEEDVPLDMVFEPLGLAGSFNVSPENLLQLGIMLNTLRSNSSPLLLASLLNNVGCSLGNDQDFRNAFAAFKQARAAFISAGLSYELTIGQTCLENMRELERLGYPTNDGDKVALEGLFSAPRQPLFKRPVIDILNANLDAAASKV